MTKNTIIKERKIIQGFSLPPKLAKALVNEAWSRRMTRSAMLALILEERYTDKNDGK